MCGERSAKIAFKKQMAKVFWKKTFFSKEQPVSSPLPYQLGSIDEREKISAFWRRLIS